MASVPSKTSEFLDTPEVQFWQECRRRSQDLGVPAWLLAEEGFIHQAIDRRSETTYPQ